MVFPLKNNKINKYKFDNNKLEKFKSIFTKVKHVAKNVIYLKGWSKEDLNKKINYVRFNKNNVELWYIKGVYQEHFNDSFDILLMMLSY